MSVVEYTDVMLLDFDEVRWLKPQQPSIVNLTFCAELCIRPSRGPHSPLRTMREFIAFDLAKWARHFSKHYKIYATVRYLKGPGGTSEPSNYIIGIGIGERKKNNWRLG